jgi:hypothetical protein
MRGRKQTLTDSERKMNRSEVSSKWNKCRIYLRTTKNDHRHHHKFIEYEKRLRKEGKNMFGSPIKQNLCHFSAYLRGKQTQILTSMLQHPGYWHKNRFGLAHVSACSAYLSSKTFATSARVWTRSTSLRSFQRSNCSPTYILHLFHLENT